MKWNKLYLEFRIRKSDEMFSNGKVGFENLEVKKPVDLYRNRSMLQM